MFLNLTPMIISRWVRKKQHSVLSGTVNQPQLTATKHQHKPPHPHRFRRGECVNIMMMFLHRLRRLSLSIDALLEDVKPVKLSLGRNEK
jgi:hypothetical protein